MLDFCPTTLTKSKIRFAFVGLFSFKPRGCVLSGGKKDSPKEHMLFKMVFCGKTPRWTF